MNTATIQSINTEFQQAISTHEQALEYLAAPAVIAGEILTTGLLDGGKIMTCGIGRSSLQAIALATLLLSSQDRQRPGLPAVALNADSSTITAIGDGHQQDQVFSRQVHALANEADILVVFSTTGHQAEICRAIEAAHQYQAPIVLFSGRDGGQAAQLLEDNDCELRVPSQDTNRIHEAHLLLVHCLCHNIDSTLFG